MDYDTILKNSLELAQRLAEHQPSQGEFGWSETERQRLEQFRELVDCQQIEGYSIKQLAFSRGFRHLHWHLLLEQLEPKYQELADTEWSTPLMSIEELSALPPEVRAKVHQSWAIATTVIELLKWSSLRYELGTMTKEEAGILLGFAYLPVRHSMAFVRWRNTDPALAAPRLWTFDEYYDALLELSQVYKNK